MSKLKLTLACGRYDRTQPLIDGRVEVEGVDLTFLPLRPGETFWRMLTGWTGHRVVRDGTGWKIRAKQVNLIDCDQCIRNPSIVL